MVPCVMFSLTVLDLTEVCSVESGAKIVNVLSLSAVDLTVEMSGTRAVAIFRDVDVLEVCVKEVGVTEIGVSEIVVIEVDLAEVRVSEIAVTEVGVSVVGVAESVDDTNEVGTNVGLLDIVSSGVLSRAARCAVTTAGFVVVVTSVGVSVT